jgi:hypothetical protein
VRKRWTPWKFAAWGVALGIFVTIQSLREHWPLPPGNQRADAQMAGAITFNLILLPILFWLVAVIRNWAVGASK